MSIVAARTNSNWPELAATSLPCATFRRIERRGVAARGKGQLHDRLPLSPDVGQALAEYIRLDRKSSSRALFVKKRPPHVGFKDGQVLNNILRRAYVAPGLKPPVPYVGSHILRHSLATALVRRGASLEEIGDMLRHRSRSTTMIYAKLDVDGLRTIAQS